MKNNLLIAIIMIMLLLVGCRNKKNEPPIPTPPPAEVINISGQETIESGKGYVADKTSGHMTIYNSAIITNNSDYAFLADGFGRAIVNTSVGEIKVKNGYGIKVINSAIAYNQGKIDVENGSVGIYAGNESKIINSTYGIINIWKGNGIGLRPDGENSIAINYGTINLQETRLTFGECAYGFYSNSKTSKLINAPSGKININFTDGTSLFYSAGMYNAYGGLIENYGLIQSSENSTGLIYGIRSKGETNNFGIIKLSSTDKNIVGMIIESGTGKNFESGIITMKKSGASSVLSSGIGVKEGIGENYGIINISGKALFGIVAEGSNKAIAINQVAGIINVYSTAVGNLDGDNISDAKFLDNGAVGIGAIDGGIAKNYGTVYVDGNLAIGAYIDDMSTLYLGSSSKIVIKSTATNSVGIRIKSGATITIEGSLENYGIVNGGVGNIGIVPYGSVVDIYFENTGNISDEKGNRLFFLDGGTIVSQQHMEIQTDFNVNHFGKGKFVMGSYAKLSASNVSGDIYLAPDMVPLYANFGTIKNAITQNSNSNESNWFKANLKSYSEFFVAKDVTYDETGKAVNLNLERKSFDTVLSDKNLAKYLEDNYTNTNSSNKDKFYDGILRTDLTAAQTEDKIRNMFGVEFYPAYQNLVYDLTSYNNKMIFDNYATLDYEKEGTSPVVGIETRNFDFKGVDNKLQGYKGNESSMFVGFDTFGTKNFRFGGLGIINRSNATFENKSKFENTYFYQANIYFAYKLESSKVDFFLSPYIGAYNGDITRTVDGNNVETVGTGKYFGSLVRANRNFDLGFMYILPEVQFDYGQNQQDEINEIGLTSVNFKANSTTKSNILGALKFGKIFDLGNELKLDTSLRGDYSKELGNPIGDVNVQVAGAENGSYTINNYTKIGAESNAIVRVALSKPFFALYVEYAYSLAGDRTTGGTITSGLQYKFNY
ncbi:hypothetical protein [Romboutsia sp.]|uniref:hypothetical protein n=1 Tax=Romboutsia sp. TaxID=1965302 RepID=UPI003F3B21CC